jgi:pimeloyl-ACP methyl ester carboxylesterase
MRPHVPSNAKSGKFVRTIFPAATLLLAGVLAILVLIVYKTTHPGAVPEAVDPSYYLLQAQEIEIPSGNGKDIPGWWISGFNGAPGIILAPGYGMNRSDALSLAVALRENGFNLLIYDQRGSGATPRGASTLGLREADDMTRAIDFLRSKPGSDPSRMGIWGVDVSARAALKAAVSFPEVRVIAADGAFEFAADFLNLRIHEDFGLDSRLLQIGCGQIFRLVRFSDGSPLNEPLSVRALSNRTILFIQGGNRERLGRLTDALYRKIRPRKEIISLKAARIHLMSGEELRSYDRQVADYFRLNLR